MKTDVMEIEGMGGDMRGSVAGTGSVSDHIVAKIPLVEQWRPVCGLKVMGQTVWVIHSDQSSLYAYPVTSPHQPQTLSIQGMSNPTNMVRFPPGQSQLVISDYLNNQLLWVKVEQRDGVWKVTSKRSVKVTYDSYGLGVRDNQLLVCDDNVIHVLSTSGEETHRVNMLQGVMPYKAIAQLTSPGFVIMDCDNKQVVLVTEKGEIQHTYRGQEGFNPYDIVCHGHSIYATDYHDHCNDGRHIRQLISEQTVRRPSSMCVDEEGKREVWVMETTDTPTNTQMTPGDRILIHQTNMNLSVTWCD